MQNERQRAAYRAELAALRCASRRYGSNWDTVRTCRGAGGVGGRLPILSPFPVHVSKKPGCPAVLQQKKVRIVQIFLDKIDRLV
jgi:hypothetical protein